MSSPRTARSRAVLDDQPDLGGDGPDVALERGQRTLAARVADEPPRALCLWRGPGVFYNSSPVDLCRGARNTFISLGPNTYYFTTAFELPASLPLPQFTLTHLVDDGAVFYLNGVELSRFNMPGGPFRP